MLVPTEPVAPSTRDALAARASPAHGVGCRQPPRHPPCAHCGARHPHLKTRAAARAPARARSMTKRQQRRGDGRRDEAVHAVHEAAMAGDQVARILDAEAALERRIRRGRRPAPRRPAPRRRAASRTARASGTSTAEQRAGDGAGRTARRQARPRSCWATRAATASGRRCCARRRRRRCRTTRRRRRRTARRRSRTARRCAARSARRRAGRRRTRRAPTGALPRPTSAG